MNAVTEKFKFGSQGQARTDLSEFREMETLLRDNDRAAIVQQRLSTERSILIILARKDVALCLIIEL